MKTELTLEKRTDSFGFEMIENNEMNCIVGGADVVVEVDPETGKLTVFIRPTRP
jgi:hypothetical protein